MMLKLAKILSIVSALLFGISPALADLTLSQLNGFNATSGASAASVTFVGCTVSASDLTTYTFTNHATGTAGARKTIVGVGGSDGTSNFSVNTVTVGGASATEVVDSADASAIVQSAIYIIDNPSGTTASIVVTFSEAVTGAVVCVWAAYDVTSETATATANQFQTSSAAITLSLNINSGGFGVAMSSKEFDGATTVWTGMTERSNASVESGVSSYAAADTTTAGTPLTVTVDWSGSSDSIGASASFR